MEREIQEKRRFPRVEIELPLHCKIGYQEETNLTELEIHSEDISVGGLRIRWPSGRVPETLELEIETSFVPQRLGNKVKIVWVKEEKDSAGNLYKAGAVFEPRGIDFEDKMRRLIRKWTGLKQ